MFISNEKHEREFLISTLLKINHKTMFFSYCNNYKINIRIYFKKKILEFFGNFS
jgi:hypothetical protein